MRWPVLFLAFFLYACAGEPEASVETPPAEPNALTTPTALIEAMRTRYDGKWYETLTFIQETIQYRQDGSIDTTTWYEAYTAPGKLRIDFAPIDQGNGLLFADDVRYTLQGGTATEQRPQVHPLLLLGFDVYHLPAAESTRKLESLGFDLSKMYETMWQDRATYVVGAESEAEKAPTFWIDKEHLYFIRMIRYIGPDSSNVQEVQFNNYQRLGGGWIAPQVLFTFDGQPTMKETYSAMRTGVALDTTLFAPDRWHATHWYTPAP